MKTSSSTPRATQQAPTRPTQVRCTCGAEDKTKAMAAQSPDQRPQNQRQPRTSHSNQESHNFSSNHHGVSEQPMHSSHSYKKNVHPVPRLNLDENPGTYRVSSSQGPSRVGGADNNNDRPSYPRPIAFDIPAKSTQPSVRPRQSSKPPEPSGGIPRQSLRAANMQGNGSDSSRVHSRASQVISCIIGMGLQLSVHYCFIQLQLIISFSSLICGSYSLLVVDQVDETLFCAMNLPDNPAKLMSLNSLPCLAE